MQVLVVDDDMATVDVIFDTVDWERLGIAKVFTSYNIESAKKVLREQEVDIIISDIEMPQGSGLDLLAWFREQQLEGEFLLLTCHESFDYATNAVKLHAAEYLLKPFDPVVMEAALRKIILRLDEKRQLEENSKYGKWVKDNQRQMQINFWKGLLDGHISPTPEKIREEITQRNLEVDADGEYFLVVSKITDIERDKERIHPNLMIFILENIHSEILCGAPENRNVVCYDYKDYYALATICRTKDNRWQKERCDALIQEFKQVFSASMTCCITRTCKIGELYDMFWNSMELIAANVMYYGTSFHEEQCTRVKTEEVFFLSLRVMEEMLDKKQKMDFLSYLKKRLNEKAAEKNLSEKLLQQAKEEILQVVYAYLAKSGIQASGLFRDEAYEVMTQKAARSVTDMVRWVNYLLERTFVYESEIQKSYTIVEKIQQYIREHYSENISRNEIAAEFFLAPEYLAKMYKKQTGISLKESINEYRIEQAKLLLKKGEIQISDVAMAVGFDNFTYFSTIFKKYTGLSPNQYRKQ